MSINVRGGHFSKRPQMTDHTHTSRNIRDLDAYICGAARPRCSSMPGAAAPNWPLMPGGGGGGGSYCYSSLRCLNCSISHASRFRTAARTAGGGEGHACRVHGLVEPAALATCQVEVRSTRHGTSRRTGSGKISPPACRPSKAAMRSPPRIWRDRCESASHVRRA